MPHAQRGKHSRSRVGRQSSTATSTLIHDWLQHGKRNVHHHVTGHATLSAPGHSSTSASLGLSATIAGRAGTGTCPLLTQRCRAHAQAGVSHHITAAKQPVAPSFRDRSSRRRGGHAARAAVLALLGPTHQRPCQRTVRRWRAATVLLGQIAQRVHQPNRLRLLADHACVVRYLACRLRRRHGDAASMQHCRFVRRLKRWRSPSSRLPSRRRQIVPRRQNVDGCHEVHVRYVLLVCAGGGRLFRRRATPLDRIPHVLHLLRVRFRNTGERRC